MRLTTAAGSKLTALSESAASYDCACIHHAISAGASSARNDGVCAAAHMQPKHSAALRGGSDEEGLFGEAPDDGDDDEETKASKRYAAAVAQLKKEGGECEALDEFEPESLKPDRDESKLAVLWMDVKLQNLQKKRPEDYKPGDAAHAYARGVAFLATECGAYVEAEKISVDTHDAFCRGAPQALDVDVKVFRETLAEFEASLGKQLHEGVAQRVQGVAGGAGRREACGESCRFPYKSARSKILEMVSDVRRWRSCAKDMLANLDRRLRPASAAFAEPGGDVPARVRIATHRRGE